MTIWCEGCWGGENTHSLHLSSSQMDVMVLTAGQREQEVRDLKREISDMVRYIQKLNGDLEALSRKVRITCLNTCSFQAQTC